MKILLVYPQYPKTTFWSFYFALKFVAKKACFPPLGLLTVASFIPDDHEKKLIDMNVSKLKDSDIQEADYVFISAMVVQKESALEVIERCKALDTRIVAGGPLFTVEPEEFDAVDHLVLGEGEITLPRFLEDVKNGEPRHLYSADEMPDIKDTPLPSWELIDMKKYSSMCIQYSRGCPFDCDFCNITALYGHTPRIKSTSQMLRELDDLHQRGWRGGVFFVDDNFIGNKAKLKKEFLPELITWMKQRSYPFRFSTEASVNLADDDVLMDLMAKSGFDDVFVGIETPNDESLGECNKIQNKNRDLLALVKKIQNAGMRVQGGFILGFDNDPVSIFDRMIAFIQKSGIVTAMVGLLNAPKGTKLYQRMKTEDRLVKQISGDNTDMSMNFVPKMDEEVLLGGYQKVLGFIYSPKHYYQRVKNFLYEYRPAKLNRNQKLNQGDIGAFFKSVFRLGIFGRERKYFWKIFFWSLFRHPHLVPTAVTYMIYGYHFRKIYSCK